MTTQQTSRNVLDCYLCTNGQISLNSFLANVPILYHPENTRKPKVQGFSRGIRWEI